MEKDGKSWLKVGGKGEETVNERKLRGRLDNLEAEFRAELKRLALVIYEVDRKVIVLELETSEVIARSLEPEGSHS